MDDAKRWAVDAGLAEDEIYVVSLGGTVSVAHMEPEEGWWRRLFRLLFR